LEDSDDVDPVERTQLATLDKNLSLVAAALLCIIMCLCGPILLSAKALGWVGQHVCQGLGARMLSVEQYRDLKFSMYRLWMWKRKPPTKRCLWRCWMLLSWLPSRIVPSKNLLGLKNLLREPVRKCWTDALNTIILVSGLLTTSTYQALYSSYGNTDSGNSTSIFATGQGDAVTAVQSWFRVANTVSFLASLVTIFVSALLILALLQFATTSGEEQRVLSSWSQTLVFLAYRVTIYAFFTSLVAVLVAVGLASYGLFVNVYSNWADSIVIWACLPACLILMFAGALVHTIEDEPASKVVGHMFAAATAAAAPGGAAAPGWLPAMAEAATQAASQAAKAYAPAPQAVQQEQPPSPTAFEPAADRAASAPAILLQPAAAAAADKAAAAAAAAAAEAQAVASTADRSEPAAAAAEAQAVAATADRSEPAAAEPAPQMAADPGPKVQPEDASASGAAAAAKMSAVQAAAAAGSADATAAVLSAAVTAAAAAGVQQPAQQPAEQQQLLAIQQEQVALLRQLLCLLQEQHKELRQVVGSCTPGFGTQAPDPEQARCLPGQPAGNTSGENVGRPLVTNKQNGVVCGGLPG